MADKLDQLFELQRALMKYYGHEGPIDINTREGQNQLRETMFFLSEELFEASNLLKKKPWRKNPPDTSKEALIEEIIDVFHFYIELCIFVGIESESLFENYEKKMYKNINRAQGSY